MKKKFILTSSILMAIFAVFIFLPVIFTMAYHKNDAPGVGIASKVWEKGVNILELNSLLSTLIIILSLLSVVFLFTQYLGTKNNFLNKIKYSPVATCLVFIIASISRFSSTVPNGEPTGTATWGKYGFFEYGPAGGFYIALALVLTSAVLSFLVVSGKIKDDESTKILYTTEQMSNADELKKFKELLDSGIITQEEFDTKKKQLLGL